MRSLVFACVAACGARSAPEVHAPAQHAPQQHAPAVASVVSKDSDPQVARRRADEALRTDLQLDYERPFKPYVPPDRSATAALFADACEDGDKDACIVEAELHPLDAPGTAFHRVLANCMAGDTMSCRALPLDDKLARFPNAPGAASRSDRCQHNLPGCNLDDLRRECRDGFPMACMDINVKLTDDVPEGFEAANRFVALNPDGCRHGVVEECLFGYGDERTRISMAQRSCEIRPDTCGTLATFEGRDKAAARDHWERACEFDDHSWGVCISLAEHYLAGELDEPVAGRAQALLDWACPERIKRSGRRVLEQHPACKSAKRP